jgi:hypothetical protein
MSTDSRKNFFKAVFKKFVRPLGISATKWISDQLGGLRRQYGPHQIWIYICERPP